MRVALAERLCCPQGHAGTPLVVRADAVQDGQLVDGIAGCPSCRTEWTLRADRIVFGPTAPLPATPSPSADALMALLGLADPEALVWCDGVDADAAAALLALARPELVLADAPVRVVGALHIDGAATVPFAAGSFAAAALFRSARDLPWLASVVRALRPGGRLVADAAIAVPPGVRELARVEALWVGEREAGGAPITLRRA